MMDRRKFVQSAGLGALAVALNQLGSGCDSQAKRRKLRSSLPNIVLIYADDLGYGDLGCYGAQKVRTPHCDRLAAEGLRFTDAHSAASVCTPSRYSLITGEYAFRKKGTGIATGIEGLLIDTDRTTLASMLKTGGYSTGVVGKWHLGLGTTPTDYNTLITPGPNQLGFDYSWLLPATGDRVPCVWVENGRVVNLDPADPITLDYKVKRGEPASFVNGIPRIGSQKGGAAALWKDDEISQMLAQKSCAFIEQHKDVPFFLYLSTHNIHVPRVPNRMFINKSNCGVRGDAIMEFDWTVGRVLDKLRSLELDENTIIIVTSDNGGVLDNNGPDKLHGIGDPPADNGHVPNGPLRGTKSTIYEGGTRVPFIVRWTGKIAPGVSDALIGQVDLFATLAALTRQNVPRGQAIDSENHVLALLGLQKQARQTLLEQSNNGAPFGLRYGQWKLVQKIDRDGGPDRFELYDLANDLAETKDLAAENPQLVDKLRLMLADATRTVSPSGERQ